MPLNCAHSFRWGLVLSAGVVTLGLLEASAQPFQPQGSEYPIVGSYLGDQVFANVAYDGKYGFTVWQDNKAGSKGSTVVARQLAGEFNASTYAAFRVSQNHSGNAERPRVGLFANGAALFTWHAGPEGQQKVYTRLLTPKGAFGASEAAISHSNNADSLDASLSVLNASSAVVTWSSRGPDGDLLGVFGRLVKSDGTVGGDIFQVNQFTKYNQRNSEVAALSDGGFVVVWVSEQQRRIAGFHDGFSSVDVMGRVFDAQGHARTDEFRISVDDRICANPAVAATSNGGFTVAWSQRSADRPNGWDIYAAQAVANGSIVVNPFLVNTFVKGDQLVPQIASSGDREVVVWTSHGQDGSATGIYGQALMAGVKSGSEFRINSWTPGKQVLPSVAADSKAHFIVVWSTFVDDRGLDIHAQRYSGEATLPTPEAPSISGLSQSSIQAAWSVLEGYSLKQYEVSLDNGEAKSTGSKNSYVFSGLTPSSVHEIRVRYVLNDGSVSDWSLPGSGQTWGADDNFDGLPDDWQALYWGADSSKWPKPSEDSDGDGMSNGAEFLAGTDPIDSHSVLRLHVERSPHGTVLTWNTVPGLLYQVESSGLPPTVWQSVGAARIARSTSDTLTVSGEPKAASYRVTRVR